MEIGAFLKQSFIDWEGKNSAVIFTKGCNYRCPFCHNPELVIPELIKKTPNINHNEIFTFLESRKVWLDSVVITGGEPCMHKDINIFIRKIKSIGYPVKLDTNGFYTDKLQELLSENLIDFVAMDIKTVFDQKRYSEITGNTSSSLVKNVKKSLEILRHSSINYQLRTTVWDKFHNNDIIKALQTEFSEENYKIQYFRDGNILENYL